MAGTPVFETNIFPLTSARGFSVAGLASIGFPALWWVSQASGTPDAALPKAVAFLTLLGATCLHFSYQNFAIDPAKSRYRRFHRILWLRLGTWLPLPTVSGVVMKYFSELPIADKRGWQVENFIPYYIVMLSVSSVDHQGIVVYKFPYRHKNQAELLTQELAGYFGVPARIYEANAKL